MKNDTEFETMPDATRSRGSVPRLGEITVPFEIGEIDCEQMSEIRSCHIVHDQGAPVVAIFMGGFIGGHSSDGNEIGAYCAVPPDSARLLAAALLRSADSAEQKYGETMQ